MKINFHHEPNLKSPVMGKGYTDHPSVDEATIHCDLTDTETLRHEIAHALAWRRPWVRLATRLGNAMLLILYCWIGVVCILMLLLALSIAIPEIVIGVLYAIGMISASGFIIPKLWVEHALENEIEEAAPIAKEVRKDLWLRVQTASGLPIEWVRQNSLCLTA